MPRTARRKTKKSPKRPPLMTRQEARQFAARWKLVNERLRQERLNKTPTERFRELANLMADVDTLGWGAALEAEDEREREVWNRLRRIARGQQ